MPVYVSHVSVCELVNSPHVEQATQIDMPVGSVANGLSSSGVFYAGSHTLGRGSPAPQRYHIRFIRWGPDSPGSPCLRGRQNPSEHAVYTKHPAGEHPSGYQGHTGPRAITLGEPPRPIIHIHLRSPAQLSAVTPKVPNPWKSAPRELPLFDIAGEELAQGVWITRGRRLCGQNLVEARPGIRLAFTAALS